MVIYRSDKECSRRVKITQVPGLINLRRHNLWAEKGDGKGLKEVAVV